MSINAASIIQNAEDILKTAGMGLNDLQSEQPERRLPGLRNLVVFGRSVTNVLQKLRSTEDGFDKWYEKYVEQMKNDPLMKHFYEIRSKILKEGLTPTSISMDIGHFNSEEIKQYPRPHGANDFFLGDESGGSGWIVELTDGTIEKYYVKLNNDTIETTINLQNSPKSHLGIDVSEKSSVELSKLYLEYLQNLIKDAKIEFL